MRILFASAEALPYFKTGGLADVARALPDALVARGHDVRVIMPAYAFLDDVANADATSRIDVPWPGGPRPVDIIVREHHGGAATAFVRTPLLFDTTRPYDADADDALSLGRRFAFFCRAVTRYAHAWDADVVHLNDWQTGLVPVYARTDGMRAATLFTIHNLAYQGNFAPRLLADIDVPATLFRTENGIEFHGLASFMKAGIALADRLSTVSPTYAQEIQTPEYGAGLDGLLAWRHRVLHGVLNGIDTNAWNPATDALLPGRYSARTLAAKDECRTALTTRAQLTGDGPLLGVVARLAFQKGIDLIIDALPELRGIGCSLVVLGSGDDGYERALADAARRNPGRIAFEAGFDEPLAHLIYAGADFFLMPSRYEPCGLGQMIAQRYGTPPIARRTGGLVDTIEDGRTGFLFDDAAPDALVDAVRRAAATRDERGWPALRSRCMREDHAWTRSAAEYEQLYHLARGAGP